MNKKSDPKKKPKAKTAGKSLTKEASESAQIAKVDERRLRADQLETILIDCIPLAGGNHDPIDLSNILQFYGLDRDSVLVFGGYVIGSADYGVKRFQFRLPPEALDGISVSSKLSEVANTIQDKAVPA
jgi:hypothetical protein